MENTTCKECYWYYFDDYSCIFYDISMLPDLRVCDNFRKYLY